LDLDKVTTVDELNLRLWSYVEAEYHTHPHSSLAGRTPLEVWESGAEDIRWPTDPAALEPAFHAHVERLARADSTVLWRGVCYEVPPYLRGRKVRLRYSLLDPSRISLIDSNVEIPIRPVNPRANAHRSRNTPPPPAPQAKPATGLNAPELVLQNFLKPSSAKEKDPQGGDNE
jgi:hypothetical protein